jgi:hypothetical protein
MVTNMIIDLKWLIGSRVKDIGKQDYTWCFDFDSGGSITTESTWRLVTVEGIKATSEDHGHKFGLPMLLDVIDTTKKTVGQQRVEQYKLDSKTGDLSLYFDNN